MKQVQQALCQVQNDEKGRAAEGVFPPPPLPLKGRNTTLTTLRNTVYTVCLRQVKVEIINMAKRGRLIFEIKRGIHRTEWASMTGVTEHGYVNCIVYRKCHWMD